MDKSKITLRKAGKEDLALILEFIRELAAYEKMQDEVIASEDTLGEWMFEKQVAEAVIGEYDGQPAGFALYFHNFSTFVGKAGIYLEDLYVRPEFRGIGLGKLLLKKLAQTAVERGCGRLEWACLDWNQPSIDFYLSMGAQPMDEWTVYRVAGDSLRTLAGTETD